MINKPVLIVTGSSKGIGKFLVKHYVKKGFVVIGCSRGSVDYEINNYSHYRLDVSDEDKVKNLFKDIRKEHGRLDVLINNAGIASINHVMLTSSDESKNLFNTNFHGTFIFSREAVKLMKLNSYGRIINLSSIHVPLSLEGSSIYGSSKAAIEHFTGVLSREVFKLGITVNVLSLSIVKDSGMEFIIKKEIEDIILGQTISKEKINLNDIIHAINFFIDKKSNMISNQIMYLGGCFSR